MRKSGDQPRLLTAVMEAISNLKEGRGSTQKKIIDQVQCLLSANKINFRNPRVHIKKALRHGVQTGLIKRRGGKFKLGLDSKDYAIFKNFQKMSRGRDVPLREHRRRGKRRKSRRKRRRRRSIDRGSPDDYASGSGSGSDNTGGTPEPTDRGRRRRRRRKGRGRRRHDDGGWSSEHVSSDAKEVTPSTSTEKNKVEAKADRDKDRERERERERERDRDRDRERNAVADSDEEQCDGDELKSEASIVDDPTCGNPDCLCNLKRKSTHMK